MDGEVGLSFTRPRVDATLPGNGEQASLGGATGTCGATNLTQLALGR